MEVANQAKKPKRECPHLDTVNRSVLDFDFEKVCSVTLSAVNVYACLCCGLFFKGRGDDTPARTHSLQTSHHVFIKLSDGRVYILPDDYEVFDSSLDDIRKLLHPQYTNTEVSNLDNTSLTHVRCLIGGGEYIPGLVGLNNIGHTDSFNVIALSLSHIKPLRDFFLLNEHPALIEETVETPSLSTCFGELIRKIWSSHLFKGSVSPNVLMQAIQRTSKKQFKIGTLFDPLDLLLWLFKELTFELTGTKSKNIKKRCVINESFQGEVEIQTISVSKIEGGKESVRATRTPFLQLSLDLPPMPLFVAGQEQSNFIPQVPLMELLRKFDGTKEHVLENGEVKRYRLTKLPQYLVLCFKRFSFNNFFLEKNQTIVNFPLKHLDLRGCLHPELLNRLSDSSQAKYNLVCSIKHEGPPDSNGSYSVFLHTQNQQWYEIQDLVVRETIPQLVAVSEAYIQIYELEK